MLFLMNNSKGGIMPPFNKYFNNMKTSLLIIILIVCLSSCSQDKTNHSFSILDYTCLEENEDYKYYQCFMNNDSLSFWYNHHSYQKINDTLFFIILSSKKDKLLIYNFKTYKTNEVSLYALPKYPIAHIYYHNHDSIFIFYKRPHIYKETDKTFDFILVNGKGVLVDTYSLNDVPYIYKGNYYKTIDHNIIDQICENRIIDNNLIITYCVYLPNVDNENFINFYPKQLALYNLSTKTVKMLNIKFPFKDIGKRYNSDCFPSSYSLSFDKDHNIIIQFSHSNLLYKYHFETDSLIRINCQYDYTFENIDSTAWQEGHDYTSVTYKKVFWDSKRQVYFRNIELISYKDYLYQFILQVMDSNFNHIAYVLNKDDYNTPYYNKYSDLVAYNKVNKLPYTIQLENKIKQISWEEFETNHLKKKTTGATISLSEYLEKLQIPDNSLVVTINLNYPCGHCLERLFTKMKENRADYEKINVYYIVYDNNSNDFAETLKKRYKLSDSKFIKIDKEFLERVRLNNEPIADERYRVIDYKSEKNIVKIHSCTFKELFPLFDKMVEERLKKQ